MTIDVKLADLTANDIIAKGMVQSMLDVIAERRIAAELSLRSMQDDARKRLGASDPVGEISQSLGKTGMAEFGGQTLEAILRHILSKCYKRDLSISNADKRIDHLEKELNAERKRYRKVAKKLRRIIRRMDTRPK